MKPKSNSARFLNPTLGASLVTAIVVCLSGTSAFAADNLWTGTTSTDWNTATNWSLGVVPLLPDDAVINVKTPNIATITANPTSGPRDFRVGQGAGADGQLNLISGSATTGGGNWAFVGRNGGTGVFNLADTTGTGGALTGFAKGSGNFTCNGSRLYVGGGNDGPTGGNATLNMNTSGALTIGNDLAIGVSPGAVGFMNVDSGTITTGGWNFIGKDENGQGGKGTLNMAGGTLTNTGRTYMGQANCTGAMNLSGGSYINVNTGWGDNFFTVGDGTGGAASLTITNSSSLLQASGEFWIGNNRSVGTMTLSAGTLISNSWTVVGRDHGNGTATMSGGTWNKTGGGNFIVGDWSTGVFNQSGGTLAINGELWVGQGGDGSNGTYTFSDGSISVNNWVAVGRDNGTGSFTMTGGTWTKTGNGSNFIIGASGPGTMTQTGGLVDVQGGITWVGETNNCTGTLTIDGTAEFRASQIVVSVNGGTTGTLNLDGGTLRAAQISGGNGNDTINFDGAQIIGTGPQPVFIAGFNTANVKTDGFRVNSNGFNLTVPQALTGAGGVTKTGAGVLTLNGANSYLGANQVSNGKLVLTTAATGTGDIAVADGAALGVIQITDTSFLTATNATFGVAGATTLDIDLGNLAGNPTAAPLNVSAALTLNGAVTLNVADSLPATGIIPLVSYVGPKVGTGSFVLGTLPNGVQATLSDNGSLVSLNVISVALPIWTGAVLGNAWDIATTKNWVDGVTTLESTYTDPAPVLFNDSALDSLVILNVAVAPSKVAFNNSTQPYTLEGTGKITGPTSLVKQGTQSLTISLTGNEYTGPTLVEGGSLSVKTLANGGSPSSIGMSPSDPANLVLSGTTLNYTGANVVTNRGFTVAGTGTTINTATDLTFGGTVACINGNLAKLGTGNLTLSNPGANVLGTINPGVRVDGGTLTLSGAGTQTNAVSGELFIGSLANVPANLVLNATALTIQSWLAIGRGNGDTDTICTLTATNSTLTTGSFSSGWDDGRPNNSIQNISLTNSTWTNTGASQLAESTNATSTLTLTDSTYTAANFRAALGTGCEATVNLLGNSSITSNGASQLGQGATSKATMTIGGTSTFTSNGQLQISLTADSVCDVVIQDNGKMIKNGGWFSIGNDGKATMTVRNNGSLWANGDFNIGDVGTSDGTLYIMDSATVTSDGVAFIGKGGATKGTIIQTGGTFIANSWTPVGRFSGAIGLVEVSGGAFNHINAGTVLFAAEEGNGTITVSGTGAVSTAGTLMLSNGATGVGVFNLNGGGTLTARQITEGAGGAGMGTFNFNGGTLVAGTGANANFMNQLDAVNVQTGGAFINTNGQNVAINQGLAYADAGTGGLTKSGTGTLYLNGVHTYTGTTNVSGGTLAGTGDFAGPVVVGTGADLNPGATTGTMYGTAVTFAAGSTFTVDIAATPDTLQAAALDITGATLKLNGTPTLPVYVIARYTTRTGVFAALPVLPSGYSVNYNYTANGLTEIAITRPLTAFESWAKTKITDIDPAADATPGGDPDGDGATNITEFALDGNPLSGAADGKVVGKVANVGGKPTLVLTLPVLTGAVFTGTTEQVSDLIGGVVYKIQGSDELTAWTLAVGEVTGADKTAIEAGMPGLTDGSWTYRTFQSPGTVTEDPADFLRAVIVKP